MARPYTTFWTKPKQASGTKNKAKAPTPAAVKSALSRASVYSGPSASHKVIAHLAKKEKVQLLGLTTHWAHIALPATKIDGWVLRSLLR